MKLKFTSEISHCNLFLVGIGEQIFCGEFVGEKFGIGDGEGALAIVTAVSGWKISDLFELADGLSDDFVGLVDVEEN